MQFLSAILPIDEAFKAGTLLMQTVAGAVEETSAIQWSGFTLNKVFCCFCAIVAVLNLDDFFRIFPSLNDCFLVGKGFQQVEDSPQLERSRNSLALISLLAIMIPLSRYQLINPATMEVFPEPVRLAGTAIFVLIYLFFRVLAYRAFMPGRRRLGTYKLARKSAWSFLIIMATVMVMTTVATGLFKVPDDTARTILLLEAAILFFLYFIRKGQIFLSACGPFATFLYLCALELLPTGLFVAIVLSI